MRRTRDAIGRVALAVAATVLTTTSSAHGLRGDDGFAGRRLVPRETSILFRTTPTPEVEAWTELLIAALERWQGSIRESWDTAADVRSRLVSTHPRSIHALGEGGRRWLHAFRWEDPGLVEEGLRQLGARPMGGGRFLIANRDLEVGVVGDWIVLASRGSGWLAEAMDRIALPDEGRRAERTPRIDLAPGRIELLLRHPDPVGGATAVTVDPRDGRQAEVAFHGTYAASPLPIRTRGRLEASIVRSLGGRVALAVMESGIGLLDPRLVEAATRVPELVPQATLRQAFESRRLVVLDGEAIRLEPVGIAEVPSICVAIPVRPEAVLAEVETGVDDWLSTAATRVRSRWTEAPVMLTRTRGHEIRNFSLQPGLLAAANGHPMALAASLNWTTCETPGHGRWLVVGSSPGLVRRVSDTLAEGTADDGLETAASCGVASPDRIAWQFRELAAIRATGEDADAGADASLLDAVASVLARMGRIDWTTTVQDADRVQGRAVVRLSGGRSADSAP